MVLEQKLSQKKIDSEANIDPNVEIEEHELPIQKNHSFDIDPIKDRGNDRKEFFPASTKKKIQLTFEHVVIKTIPKARKGCRKIKDPQPPKTILNDISGTVVPG